MLGEQKKFEDEIRRQLKLQEQVHTDHLQEALAIKEQEADRKLKRVLSEQSETDSLKYKSQLAAIVGRLRGLEAALKGESFLSWFLVLNFLVKNTLTTSNILNALSFKALETT